ncbi:DUF4333 domain-containing protein [Haloactinomyces albus]|uniref:DUF4333 domain-containing protein n=1 Tax=Haloactinomyces albus TaxID=1352928 RepID=A0AAE3ZEH9_9ACTN|nr:DUF4333 domain-containing protein [Haloactinomyces albus]MDR7303468.1 hypothetical protein [Haloactinomyces albus]
MSNPHGPPGGTPQQWGNPYGPGAAPHTHPGGAHPGDTRSGGVRPLPLRPPYGDLLPGQGPPAGRGAPAEQGAPSFPQAQWQEGTPPPGQPGHYGYGPLYSGSFQEPQGFPDPALENTRTRRSRGPWLLGGLGVVAAAVVFLGFVAPGWFHRTVFSADAMQKGVQRILEDVYGVSGIDSVTCPSGEPVEASHTFECRVTVDGRNRTVTITVTDAEGTYEVGHLR